RRWRDAAGLRAVLARLRHVQDVCAEHESAYHGRAGVVLDLAAAALFAGAGRTDRARCRLSRFRHSLSRGAGRRLAAALVYGVDRGLRADLYRLSDALHLVVPALVFPLVHP